MNNNLKNIFFGLLGGAAGTFVIGKAISGFSKLQPDEDRAREQQLTTESPTEVLAERIAGKNQKAIAGQVIHWGYGILWGGIYAVLRKQFPAASFAGGLPFGVAFGVFGDAVLLPLAQLTPPATEYPVSTVVRDLAAHYAYAATVEGTCRLCEAVERAIVKHPQRTNAELRKVS